MWWRMAWSASGADARYQIPQIAARSLLKKRRPPVSTKFDAFSIGAETPRCLVGCDVGDEVVVGG